MNFHASRQTNDRRIEILLPTNPHASEQTNELYEHTNDRPRAVKLGRFNNQTEPYHSTYILAFRPPRKRAHERPHATARAKNRVVNLGRFNNQMESYLSTKILAFMPPRERAHERTREKSIIRRNHVTAQKF